MSKQQKLSSAGQTWTIARLKSEVWWVRMGVMAERQAEGRLWRDSAGRGYATGSGEPSRQFGREVATLHLHFGATMKWGGKGNSFGADRSGFAFS